MIGVLHHARLRACGRRPDFDVRRSAACFWRLAVALDCVAAAIAIVEQAVWINANATVSSGPAPAVCEACQRGVHEHCDENSGGICKCLACAPVGAVVEPGSPFATSRRVLHASWMRRRPRAGGVA